MNLARFVIEGSVGGVSPPSDRGFDAVAEETLAFRLEDGASNRVRSFQVQVYSPTNTNSPRCTKGAPLLTLVGKTSGQSVEATSPSADITTEMPDSGVHAWIVVATVNGGVNADGNPDGDYRFARMIVMRSDAGARKIISVESTEYQPEGWAEAYNGLVELTASLISPAAEDVSSDDSVAQLGSTNVQGQINALALLISAGIAPRASVVACATANVTLSGEQVVDGEDLEDDDVALLAGQMDPVENGPWIVREGAWERPPWFAPGSDAAAFFLIVQRGIEHEDEWWYCTDNSGSAEVGTDPLTFVEFAPGGSTPGLADVLAQNPDAGGLVPTGLGTATNPSDAISLGQAESLLTSTISSATEAGTSLTVDADWAGRITNLTSSSAITVTFPSTGIAPDSFGTLVTQGTGQATCAAAGGATVHAIGNANKSAGQYAYVHWRCVSTGVYEIWGDLTV